MFKIIYFVILLATIIPLMCKDIIFLKNVKPTTRQKVLNFVKLWQSDNEWIEVSTSGATGRPKIIRLHKQQIKSSAKATVEYFNLQPKQTVLLAMSTDFIAGKMMLIRALEHQLNIVVTPVKSNPLLDVLPCQIDFSAFVPMQVKTILSNETSKQNYQDINQVIIGGAPVSLKLQHQIQLLSNTSYATYGMTETISHVAIKNLSLNEEHYKALPNVSFSTTNNQQLIIDAPNILNQPIITNDVVELINSKQFIWKGRADFVINSGGVKLHPEMIEKKIEPYLPHHRFYLTSKNDELLGQKLILKIEDGYGLDIEKLFLNLKLVLNKYELPKQIISVNQFNETPSGKVIRQ